MRTRHVEVVPLEAHKCIHFTRRVLLYLVIAEAVIVLATSCTSQVTSRFMAAHGEVTAVGLKLLVHPAFETMCFSKL